MRIRDIVLIVVRALLLLIGSGCYGVIVGQTTTMPVRAAGSAQRAPISGTVHEITGLKVDGDYELYGSKYDNLKLVGASIGGALKIDGVHNVTIVDSHLRNVWFRGKNPTQMIVLKHNEISMAPGDCIQLFEGATPPTDVTIVGNRIHDCGLAFPNSDLYHAIYDQIPGVVIRGNCISHSRSAVSVRSSATIENNLIQDIPSGGGIEYFSDHNAGPGSHLVIAGNTLVSALRSQPGTGSVNRGLIVLGNDIGKGTRSVSDYLVRDNVVVLLNREEQQGNGRSFDIYEQGEHPSARFVNNTLVNLIPGSRFIGPARGGIEIGDLETHDAAGISKLALTKPGCE